MKEFRLFVIFLLCFLLQSSLLQHVSVFGVSPNLILVLVIVYSFFFENYNGLILGAVFGIMQDISFGQVIGFTGLVYMCIGMCLQFLRLSVYRDNKITLLFVTGICSAVYALMLWGLNALALPLSYSVQEVLLSLPVAVIWNYICLIVIVHFVRKTEGFTV